MSVNKACVGVIFYEVFVEYRCNFSFSSPTILSMAGLSTCHFAWAFHSEAEEELLNMIPAMQRGDPQWSELRAVGVGWWIRNINTLRKMVEKVLGHILNNGHQFCIF